MSIVETYYSKLRESSILATSIFMLYSLNMIARQGKFVEFSVFGKETSADWTIISDAKGILVQDTAFAVLLMLPVLL